MSEREAEKRAPEIGSREHFAQLMAQLESCGCGPSGAAARGAENSEALPSACEPVLENLFELVDHVMPEELEKMMLEHSAHCDHCGPAVSAEIKFREVLKRSCSEHAPEALRVKISQLTAKLSA
ncbi:MAG: hypothetical protein SPF30_00145 [Arcanobacterium sp.]|nr:hypothetical protein [Arcanobacterium sp.]